MAENSLPTYQDLMNPTLKALRELGGSATIDEIFNKVAELMQLSDEELSIIHDPEKSSRTEIEYRLAWSRTYLKGYGLLENSQRGIWSLTSKGRQTETVDPREVSKERRKKLRAQRQEEQDDAEEIDEELTWKEELLQTLLKMSPDSFERLAQRMLREAGFIQVEVTGRSGDGGIDGNGIMRLGGLLSFHVIFQCKRYQGSVSASQVRDFRGAMVGRADKGLLITTGTFTKEATREATRDGAPAIDLIDGDMLIEQLQKLNLGIKTEVVSIEKVSVDHNWFLEL
jgi:restriction system protein